MKREYENQFDYVTDDCLKEIQEELSMEDDCRITETVWPENNPKCDFCKMLPSHEEVEAKYDGKTSIGSWALMCEEHFKRYGIGLGLGKGQKLVKDKSK